jgi:branched-chain amino acid transport system permease protein
LSALMAGLFGAIKGRLTARLRDDYLAVVTLAIGLVMRQTIINLKEITGGTGGIPAVPPPQIFTAPIAGVTAQYYLVFGVAIVLAFAMQRLIASPLGKAWLAASEDEIAASAMGINVARFKILAIVISSAVAGIAGSLYAGTLAYVSPEMIGFQTSAMVLAMVILGGAGSVPGAVLGAVLVVGYNTLLIPRLGALVALLTPGGVNLGYAPDVRGASYFTFGLALYLTVLLRARVKKAKVVSEPGEPTPLVEPTR